MAYVDISEDLRKMTVPAAEKVLGCVGDRNVRNVYFRLPRYCDDIDLNLCRIQVHYVNAAQQEDYYEVPSWTVDDKTIIFAWLVGRVACVAEGDVYVNVKIRAYDGPIISREFNSGIGRFRVKPAFTSNPYGSRLTDINGDFIVPVLEEDAIDIMVMETEDSE